MMPCSALRWMSSGTRNSTDSDTSNSSRTHERASISCWTSTWEDQRVVLRSPKPVASTSVIFVESVRYAESPPLISAISCVSAVKYGVVSVVATVSAESHGP